MRWKIIWGQPWDGLKSCNFSVHIILGTVKFSLVLNKVLFQGFSRQRAHRKIKFSSDQNRLLIPNRNRFPTRTLKRSSSSSITWMEKLWKIFTKNRLIFIVQRFEEESATLLFRFTKIWGRILSQIRVKQIGVRTTSATSFRWKNHRHRFVSFRPRPRRRLWPRPRRSTVSRPSPTRFRNKIWAQKWRLYDDDDRQNGQKLK